MHADPPILPGCHKLKIIASGVPGLFALGLSTFGAVVKRDGLGLIGETGDELLSWVCVSLGLSGMIPGSVRFSGWCLYDVWKYDSNSTC